MLLDKDLREFLGLLNENKVEYLIVGAFAVAYHGFARYTADLDILISPTPENANRIVGTISQFGFAALGITAADLQSSISVIQIGIEPNRLDLLTTISGVTFKDAWANRQRAELDGIPTHYIGLAELLRNKESTGRARDLGDAEELRKVSRRKTENT